MSEQDILKTLNKGHISDIQTDIYCYDKRHVINASDVIHVIQLLNKMGFKVVKND